jgi:MarR family transcriptional regulator, organic hydroperoxide resistance regulator
VPKDEKLKLDDFLPYLVNRVGAALVERYSREALAEHSLSIDMWRVLARLADSGGQRQVDLADATSIEASTVSRIVTRLVKQGLVDRSRSKTSSREVIVELSPRGKTLVRKLIPIAHRLERQAVAEIASKDLADLKNALRRVYANLTRK